MPRGSILLIIVAIWIPTTLATFLLLRRATRLHGDAKLEAARARNCVRGNHRDALDTRAGGLPKLAWRCVDCGRTELLGTAYATGSNKRSRRASHG